ncbi:dehydrogenase/reductase SDR family member 7-like isoform X2 [Alexandromys fortis]|uniref:dehydrogenase/reductase SDR family member 7-like isoform X2 n=1 Tax=Alexandromys fortis TaxID=100897 RepID=UPI0021531EC3|nr:dehydrogenase/reductase SDR family member 7-like isoform X2 [Microtus fortis]
MCGELWLWALCALLLALWLLNFLRTDSDLTLLWAEWLGRRPEQVLTGKVVWVTGASSGIGEELALQLSKLGGSLVLSARRAQELERVKRRCLEHGNVKEKDILVLPLDLADRSSHEMATRTVLREFGRGFLNTLQSELFNYPDIKVCTICPGPVHSNIFKNSSTSVVTKTREDNTVRVPKMETSRCVRLVLISMANDLNEVWIVKQPALFGLYLWQYVPLRGRLFSRMMWKKIIKAFYIDINNFKASLHMRPSE